MLKSRRGLLAAGLAVAVVGALGVGSTLSAGAEQITGAPARPVAANDAQQETEVVPPTELPWGGRPEQIRRGRAGASSKTLRAEGFDAAPADASGSTQPRGRYAPKGRSNKSNILRSERTDIAPPEPPAPSVSASPSITATASPTATATATATVTAAETTGSPASTATARPFGTTAAAADPSSPPAPAPTASDGGSSRVAYLYNVGSQAAETDGFYTTLTIAKPYLDKTDYHSLAELAVQSADGQQIVEVGWNVDRVVNGDDDPHLFVYHWVNRTTTCYNGCGFVPYSKATIKPGDTLAYDVNKKFGIQFHNGSWWIAFDSEWVGYFPEALWNEEGVEFSRSGLVQVFGEVAATSDKPCTDMGNGQLSEKTTAAYLASVTYLNGPTVALNIRSTTDIYTVTALSGRTFRYGGPGAC